MKLAIHQPHYFPWIGYFDKMAKVDRFVLMDEVQLANKSYMVRNSFLQRNGQLTYLTIPCEKKGYREKGYNEIKLIPGDTWQKQHMQFFETTFKYSPFKSEVLDRISPVFTKEYEYIADATEDSIRICMDMLDIKTETVKQSELDYDRDRWDELESSERKSNNILDMCLSEQADAYMTGTGASLRFLDRDIFGEANVKLAIQSFDHPHYEQRFSEEFVEGISILDMFFNIGIEASKELFWNNVRSKNEFED